MRGKNIHEGRNIKRLREILGMKQETLACELGDDWKQKKISLLEAKESIEPAVLETIAKALKLPPEAIKNFDEASVVAMIGNTANEKIDNQLFSFNLLEKWLETMEENKKLYIALLREKDEKITLLEKMLTK